VGSGMESSTWTVNGMHARNSRCPAVVAVSDVEVMARRSVDGSKRHANPMDGSGPWAGHGLSIGLNNVALDPRARSLLVVRPFSADKPIKDREPQVFEMEQSFRATFSAIDVHGVFNYFIPGRRTKARAG
jgi:hypothetical protein